MLFTHTAVVLISLVQQGLMNSDKELAKTMHELITVTNIIPPYLSLGKLVCSLREVELPDTSVSPLTVDGDVDIGRCASVPQVTRLHGYLIVDN